MRSIGRRCEARQSDWAQRGRVADGVPSSEREINNMKHLLILAGLCMAASAVAPVTMLAEDHHGEKRYYDRDGRDYHYWNDGEDRQYRAYLVEQHRAYVPFVSVNVRRRQEYWRYRHQHGFGVGVEVR
jgi:hypothetical protein